jgi:hypothetical protein
MSTKILITAAEIAEELGTSKAFAYKLIQKMNKELVSNGYYTVSGKVSRQFYKERIYGQDPNSQKGAQY